MNDIIQYDRFFSFNVVERITSKINEPRWRHGHGSHVDENNNSLGIPFWRMDLLDDTYFSDYLLNIIREKTQQDYDLYDVYANGHTFGIKENSMLIGMNQTGEPYYIMQILTGDQSGAGRLYFFLTKKNYFIKILYQTLLFFSPVTHHTWQREHLDYFLD